MSPTIMSTPMATTTPTPVADAALSSSQILSSLFRRLFVVLTYPCMLILTAISLVLIVAFCVLPTIICMSMAVCTYYCFCEDPIPPTLLLQYMFSGVNPHGADRNFGGSSGGQADRGLLRSKLIVRRLLLVEIMSSSSLLSPAKEVNDDKRVPGEELDSTDQDGDGPTTESRGFILSTENKTLHFSEPLLMDVEEGDDGDKSDEKGRSGKKEKKIGIDGEDENHIHDDDNSVDDIAVLDIPHYQCSSENQNLNTNLRETTAPDTASDSEPRQNDVDGQEASMCKCRECNDIEEITDGGGGDDKIIDRDGTEIDMETGFCFGVDGDMRDRGTTCDICLLEFAVWDEVAFSPNTDCSHIFHKDCILDW